MLIDLTIKVANTIRSARLAKSIFTLVGKLEGVMESGLSLAKREIVFSLAQKFSLMAQTLGQRFCQRLGIRLLLCKLLSCDAH